MSDVLILNGVRVCGCGCGWKGSLRVVRLRCCCLVWCFELCVLCGVFEYVVVLCFGCLECGGLSVMVVYCDVLMFGGVVVGFCGVFWCVVNLVVLWM